MKPQTCIAALLAALLPAPILAFNADIKTVTVNGGSADASPLALRFFTDAAFTVPAPIGTTVWFVADKSGNGVPTSPAAGAILGADDVLLHRDVVDGDQPGSRAGGFRRLGVVVPDEFRTAPIYVYVWNGSGADFAPANGSKFGLHRLGVLPVPDIGNAAWLIDQNVFAGQHTVGGDGTINQPPVFGTVAAPSLPELAAWELSIPVSDPDAGQLVTLTLGNGAPAGLTIDSAARKLRWTPTELQGPGQFAVKVVATDSGTPAASAELNLDLTVTEANSAPNLASVTPQSVEVGQQLVVPLSIGDDHLPAQTLSLSLVSAPVGVTLNGNAIHWTPTLGQAGNQAITVRVADSGSPSLAAETTIAVTVTAPPPVAPTVTTREQGGRIVLAFTSVLGRTYRLESRAQLGSGNWAAKGAALPGTGSMLTVEAPISLAAEFFRVTVD